jgi:hypothetical protein
VSRSAPTYACHKQVGPFDLGNSASNVTAVKLRYHSGPESRNCTLLYGTLFMGSCVAKLYMIGFLYRSDHVRGSFAGEIVGAGLAQDQTL